MDSDRQALRWKITALAVFAVSFFFQTYPLGLHPARGLNDTQDCLLNTWILERDHQQILKNPLKLFETNAFYPNVKTLSYSEHMLPLALLSWPVSAATGNPVLGYNFVFFLCCLLNAYAMFLLVKYLTNDPASGIAAGLIFAFSATLMQQIAHLQLLAAWFIPLGFLYLHRFFESRELKHSIAFSACLTLQSLACVYYGLFFLSILIVALPVLIWLNWGKLDGRFWRRLIPPLLAGGTVMVLFSLPYLWLFRHFRFARPLAAGAEIQNYLAVPPHNVLLSGLLHRLGSYEFFLFPGIAAIALGGFYLFKRRESLRSLSSKTRTVFYVLAILNALVLAVILLSGGTGFKLGPVSISARNPARPAFGLLMVLTVWFIVSKVKFGLTQRDGASETDRRLYLYLVVLGWALFLSFGRGFGFIGGSPFNQRFHGDLFSPFHWLYDFVPGFKGIRVPSRYAVFVLMSVAVLAGYGWQLLSARLRAPKSRALGLALLAVFLNAEFLSVPQRLRLVPAGGDVPPTYQWLKEQPGDFAIMELPLFEQIPDESAFMYLSLYHGKRIVNGYSGFIPYSTEYMRSVFRQFPSQGATDILQRLQVKYVVYHAKTAGGRPRPSILDKRNLLAKLYSLKFVREFRYGFRKPNSLERFLGEDAIYEVLPPRPEPPRRGRTFELGPGHWTAQADLNPDLLPRLSDGNPATAWTTGRGKRPKDYLNIVLDEPRPVDRVEIPTGNFIGDWAVNIQINVSEDGRHWRIGYPGFSPGEFTRDLIDRPHETVQVIRLRREKVRYLKIFNTGPAEPTYWSVPEIRIFVAEDETPPGPVTER